MISIAECFNHINFIDCIDVATSLALDGISDEISIPIYEVFNLHITRVSNAQYMCSSMPEFGALQHVSKATGGVVAGINVEGFDILTLVSVLMNNTLNGEFNLFIKINTIDLESLSADTIQMMADICRVPIDISLGYNQEMVENLLQTLLDKLMQIINNDTQQYGINTYSWEHFEDYYANAKATGELQQMYNARLQLGAIGLNG